MNAILFTDWDGTVTLQDSNDLLTDNLGMGLTERMKLNDLIKNNKVTFRSAFYDMLESVNDNNYSFQYCIDFLLKNVQIDPDFENTLIWCTEENIPVVIVSSGMDKIINELLLKLIPNKLLHSNIHIYANHVNINEDNNTWHIKYRDDSSFGHDKNQSILSFKNSYSLENPKLYYCGDGVSDISASRSCDYLFAKSGHDLVDICKRDGINHIEFKTFNDILATLKSHKM